MSLFSAQVLSEHYDKVYKFIFNLYNTEAKKYNLEPALKMTNKRKMLLSRYIDDYTMDDVFIILRELRKAKNFIYGCSWLTLDWLLNPDNHIKLMEGKYRDSKFSYKQPTIESKAQYKERKY